MEPGEEARRTKKEKKTGRCCVAVVAAAVHRERENETRGTLERGGKIREERGNERELFSRVLGSSMGGVKTLRLRQ